MRDEIAVKAENVSKFFGSVGAVKNVDVKIPKNKVFAIAGPNGSGKTTLLNLLAGTIEPSSGSIWRDPSLRIGYSYQHPKIAEELSVKENIDFFSDVCEASNRKWVEYIIGETKMKKWENYRVNRLSSGTKKRFELAISLLHNPDLIILDEPTAGLDVDSIVHVVELIKLLRSKEKTIIIATHQLGDFEGLCDHLAILLGGEIVFSKPIEELKQGYLLELEDKQKMHMEEKEIEKAMAKIDFSKHSRIVLKKQGLKELYEEYAETGGGANG